MPNPNMTYEELQQKLGLILSTYGDEARANGPYAPLEAREIAQKSLTQLFATLGAEVIGQPKDHDQFCNSLHYDDICNCGALEANEMWAMQYTRLAQLTTKNK